MERRVSRRFGVLTAAVLLAVCGCLTAQELYKWTDEHGNVHYGDKPPADAEDITNLDDVVITATENSIPSSAVKVEASETDGISRYVLLANEKLSTHSDFPSQFVVSNGDLWLTFKNSVLKFDPRDNTATKYRLDHIRHGLSGQHMLVSGDEFVFFPTRETSTQNEFHVYNHATGNYAAVPIGETPQSFVNYDDNYGDGLFAFNYGRKTLVQYTNVEEFGTALRVVEVEHPVGEDLTGIRGLAANSHSVWYISGYKKPCTVAFFDKRDGATTLFTSDEIGTPASDGCASIVADDDEVWIVSTTNRNGAVLSVYDVEKRIWDVLQKSENNIELVLSPLRMDTQRVYYNKCEKLFAINRKSRLSTVLSISDIDPTDSGISCINFFQIYANNVWTVVYESHDRRRYPVLYKIPTHKMNP